MIRKELELDIPNIYNNNIFHINVQLTSVKFIETLHEFKLFLKRQNISIRRMPFEYVITKKHFWGL